MVLTLAMFRTCFIAVMAIAIASCCQSITPTSATSRPAVLVFHDLPDSHQTWSFSIAETGTDYAVVQFRSHSGLEHRAIISPVRLSEVIDEFAAAISSNPKPVEQGDGIDLTLDDGQAVRRFHLDSEDYTAALWKSPLLLNLLYQFVPDEFKARRHSIITLGNQERGGTDQGADTDEQIEWTFTGFDSGPAWKFALKTELKDGDATLVDPPTEKFMAGWVLLFFPQSTVFDELNAATGDAAGPASIQIQYSAGGVTKTKTITGSPDYLTRLLHRCPRFSVLCWQCAPAVPRLKSLGY